ncbi:MAG TPA: hypothetical protein VIF82_04795 [Burkholderiaceae bacterium]
MKSVTPIPLHSPRLLDQVREAIRELMEPIDKIRKRSIGFVTDDDKPEKPKGKR